MDCIKRVYVANAKANTVDSWLLTGKIPAIYQGKKEILCMLSQGRKTCALPERCVFETEESARAALNRK